MKKEVLEKIYNGRKNLIVEGVIGTGKTKNVLLPLVDKMISNGESLFVVDSREEYLNKYYNLLKKENYNIIIINMRDLDKSEGWNPLDYPFNLYKNGERDKAQEYVEKIGKIIFHEDSYADPFWASTASNFFTGLTLSLFEDGRLEEINFNSINDMFKGFDKKFGETDVITEYFKAKGVGSKTYILAASTFLAPQETKGGILAVARQKLMLYVSREKLSYLMNRTTFDLNNIASKPTAIFFIARDESRYLNSLTTMFIEQLFSILVDLHVSNRFNFVLDNFDVVDNCNDLIDILGSCLSRKIKLFMAVRSLDKLVNCYGKYILSLCDLININYDNITLSLNNESETIPNEFENVNIESCDIQYPSLIMNKIECFDVIHFVRVANNLPDFSSITIESVRNNLSLNDRDEKKEKMEKAVNNKMEELELNSQIEEFKKTNDIKSELEQFKIEN